MTKKTKAATASEDINLSITEGALARTSQTDQSMALAPPGVPNLTAIAAHFNVTTDNLGELARIGADSVNRAMFEITRAGMAFLRAQELLSRGNFGKGETTVCEQSHTGGFIEWINGHGLAKERVYEAMRIAKFVAQLPQDQLEDVLALGKVKVMLLASLPQEVIDQAAESGNDVIGKADLMTAAELKEEIRSLKRREKNYDAELERLNSKVKRLSEDRKRTTDLLLRTEEIREESMALQLEAELPLNRLQKLFAEVNSEGGDAPECQLQLEHLWIVANVVAARALDLVALIKETACTADLPHRVMGTHILTPDEAQQWLLDYGTIENRHAAAAVARQEKRDAAKPRGVGRPKKSSNKEQGE